MSAMEEVIRKLAYELWEQAGRPDGRSDEFCGSQRDTNSNAGRRQERHRWARLSAGVSRRLVMKRPLIGRRDLVVLRCSSWNGF